MEAHHPGRLVKCTNEACSEHISLPPSILPGIPGSQDSWREAGETANLVCLECGQVFDYTGSPPRGDPSPKDDPYLSGVLRDGRLVFECGQDSCRAQAVIHRPTKIGTSEQAIGDEARSRWRFVKVRCPQGHVVPCLPDSVDDYEIFP